MLLPKLSALLTGESVICLAKALIALLRRLFFGLHQLSLNWSIAVLAFMPRITIIERVILLVGAFIMGPDVPPPVNRYSRYRCIP